MSKVAVVQMVSTANVDENLAIVEQAFITAHNEGALLLTLPENFAFMGIKAEDKLNIAEVYGQGRIQDKVSYYAKHFEMWVIAGTIPIKANDQRVYASAIVYDNYGNAVARYNKIHLFNVSVSPEEAYHESETIIPGSDVVVVDTPVGKIGLSVCYDLRFPELYRQLASQGAEIFSISSAFTATTGKLHWHALLKARAIENLCYVLAPNQGGKHPSGQETYGHSMIIEPWGQILAEHPLKFGVLTIDLDLKALQSLRQQFPCHQHRVLIG